MIHRLVYGGELAKVVDGKKEIVTISPLATLRQVGAFLEVTIMPPRIMRESLEKEGKRYPTKTVRALVDTGAYSSIIRPEIAVEVGLKQTGFATITSVQDQQQQPVYFGSIGFSWGSSTDTPLTGCPISGFECLIGRDVLQYWYLTYDGPNGTIVVCD